MQKFYTAIRSMPNGSEHTHIMGDVTRKQALIDYSVGLRMVAIYQRPGKSSSMQLFEDGIILRSDTIEGGYIRQDKVAK